MKTSRFVLGFGFILIGLAVASVVNYLDMRQFETRLNEFVANDSPLAASGIYQGLKAKDGFSQKYISPELAVMLMRDYSTVNLDAKSQLEDIRNSVSKKKSDALHNIGLFLCLASITFMSCSAMQKNEQRKSIPANATA
jgi:hypothetical protein